MTQAPKVLVRDGFALYGEEPRCRATVASILAFVDDLQGTSGLEIAPHITGMPIGFWG
jgi:hypothetical protein